MSQIAVTILATTLVIGSFVWLSRILGITDKTDKYLAGCLLGLVWIVISMEVCGLLWTYSPVALGGMTLVPLSIAGLARRFLGSGTQFESAAPASETTEVSSGLRISASCRVACGVSFAAFLGIAAVHLMMPVEPISDAPIYHLYFAIRWWQEGTIGYVPTPFGESAAPYFPANIDVWFCWLVAIGQNESLAKIGQWPFHIVTGMAVLSAARHLGASREGAWWAAALWLSGSVQLTHTSWAIVDLGLAACYLTAIVFLLRFRASDQLVDIALASLAIGVVFGCKYVAIMFAAPLVASAIVLISKSRRPNTPTIILSVACMIIPCIYWYGRNWLTTGNPLYPLHVEFAGVTLFEGWYRRISLTSIDNRYHIPVEQMDVLLTMILRFLDPFLVPWWLTAWFGAIAFAAQRVRIGLIGGLAIYLILVFWFVNPYQSQDRFLFPAIALLALGTACGFGKSNSPSPRWMRWLAPVLAASILLHLIAVPRLGFIDGWAFPSQHWSFEHLPFVAQLPPVYSVVTFCLIQQGGSLASLVSWVALFSFVTTSWCVLQSGVLARFVGTRRVLMHAALILLIILPTLAIASFTHRSRTISRGLAHYRAGGLSQSQAARAARFYPEAQNLKFLPGWLTLESLSSKPLNVAYAGTNLPYYLFGTDLQNRVRYVNVNSNAGYAMHDYHLVHRSQGGELATSQTPDWDRRKLDRELWLKNLHLHEMDVLFVARTNMAGGGHNVNPRDPDQFPIEREWAESLPQSFERIHTDSETAVYRVLP